MEFLSRNEGDYQLDLLELTFRDESGSGYFFGSLKSCAIHFRRETILGKKNSQNLTISSEQLKCNSDKFVEKDSQLEKKREFMK